MRDQTTVELTESIAYSGFWRRAGAVIIDTMALQSCCLLLAVGVFFITPEDMTNSVSKVLDSLFFLLFVVYEPLMEGSRYQATIGKMASGIQVTSLNGERISWGRAFGRRFAMLLSMLPMFIGFLFPVFNRKKQALHDMIAQTVVLDAGVSYFWRVMIVTLVLYVAILASAGFYVAKNLGAWITSGMTTAAVVLKEETVKAHGQSAIVQEKVNDKAPIKPYTISERQYEELLANSPVNFTPDPEKPTVFPVKPIALELSSFFEGNSSQWVEIHVSPGINLGRGGYAIVRIDNVLNGKGEDIYDKTNSLETEFFQTIFKSIISKDRKSINETRIVNVKKDVKETDIKSVSGVIKLYLPINTQTITISGADVGKTKAISPDLQIMVQRFGNGEVSVDAIGMGKNLLLNNFYAYSAKGSLLENDGRSSSGVDSKRNISWKVKGTPSTAQLVVAEKMLEKEYPFTLKK